MDEPFDQLGEAWFTRYGLTIPEIAAKEWRGWLKKNKFAGDETKLRTVLRFASGLSEAAIRHYRNEGGARLSPEKRGLLDDITAALGFEALVNTPPVRPNKRRHRRISIRRVVLLTQLERLPSPSYHLEVIHNILREAMQRNMLLSVHEASFETMDATIEHIIAISRPDAVIMIRMTPGDEAIARLQKAKLPTVLIHADDRCYPIPILANIVPYQKTIRTVLEKWITTTHPRNASNIQRPVVIISMPKETTDVSSVSIRNERITLIEKALTGYRVIHQQIPDYSFRHALTVYQTYPDALVYICLSDEIAVGLKHILEAVGETHQDRIIGFDNSRLAMEEDIPSFDQCIVEVGKCALDIFVQWMNMQEDAEPVVWEKPSLPQIAVKFEPR